MPQPSSRIENRAYVFARFAREDAGIESAADLTSAMVGRYILWLDSQRSRKGEPWRSSYKKHLLSSLRNLVAWIKRHRPDSLPGRIDIPSAVYDSGMPDDRPQLSEAMLKALLVHCYAEIDEAWERFQIGRKILKTTGSVDGVDPNPIDHGLGAVSSISRDFAMKRETVTERWPEPVIVQDGSLSPISVHSAAAALDYLEHLWHAEKGRYYQIAKEVCLAATKNQVSADAARENFIRAVLKARLRMCAPETIKAAPGQV